jgi:hypothetical protein
MPTPLPEDQPALFTVDVPEVTPEVIVRPRKGRGKISHHHRWLQGKIRARGQELVDVLIEAALARDMVAMKLVLERGWGLPVRAASPLDLPAAKSPDQIVEAMAAVFERVSTGEIDMQTAAELIVSYRHMLAAAETRVGLLPPAVSGNGAGQSARDQLGARLARLIQARAGAPSDTSDADAPGDRTEATEATEAAAPPSEEDIEVDISEEELKASVNSAVMEALRKRGYVE